TTRRPRPARALGALALTLVLALAALSSSAVGQSRGGAGSAGGGEAGAYTDPGVAGSIAYGTPIRLELVPSEALIQLEHPYNYSFSCNLFDANGVGTFGELNSSIECSVDDPSVAVVV